MKLTLEYKKARKERLVASRPSMARAQPCCVSRHFGVQALQLQHPETKAQSRRAEDTAGRYAVVCQKSADPKRE